MTVPRGNASPDKIRYELFDASAAVKLFIDEKGSDLLRQSRDSGMRTITTPCLIETLSVLKRNWLRKEITDAKYHDLTYTVPWQFKEHIHDVSIKDPDTLIKISKLGEKHALDFVDALQIYSLLHSHLAVFTGGSQTLLITADDALAVAAGKEGLKVWNLQCDTIPPS